jgi:uncharacterized protein
MIAEFKVKNFLSIREEQRLSFLATADDYMINEYSMEVKKDVRLLKLGMIYGANASGKSNILFALSFLMKLMTDIPKDKTIKIPVIPFMLDNKSRDDSTDFYLDFYLNKERYVLSIKLNEFQIFEEKLIYYPGVQPAVLFTRTYDKETDSSNIDFGKRLTLSKKSQQVISGNTIKNCSVMAAFGKSNVESSRLNTVYDFFSGQSSDVLEPTMSLLSFIKKMLRQDKDDCLKTFLKDMLKASDFNVADLKLNQEEKIITSEMEKVIQSAPISDNAKQEMLQKGKITDYELLFSHQTDKGIFDLPENLESRGTIRFMGMSVILKQLLEKNKIILIDEVETSIHFELLSYFFKVFLANSQKNAQLVVTTHDINLLNEPFIRRDSVWFTDKDSEGQTKLVRLSSLGLHKNLSPYNAYKQGKLVKLPFFDSIYLKNNNLCDQR